jgi:predicted phosphodiesterase
VGADPRDPAGGLTLFTRVAALADVHGNAPALEAVLAEVEAEAPDLIVFCGDLTWGPLPEETLELARGLEARFVRGNGYERVVDGTRLLNPGSVGLPYEGRAGAYWALLGPGVDHRRTEYDLEEAERRIRAAGGPFADLTMELLRAPPSREEAIEHAEMRAFSG